MRLALIERSVCRPGKSSNRSADSSKLPVLYECSIVVVRKTVQTSTGPGKESAVYVVVVVVVVRVQCSRGCGGGSRRRLVRCINMSGRKTVADEHCSAHQKPAEQQDCNTAPCQSWTTSAWLQVHRTFTQSALYRVSGLNGRSHVCCALLRER